MGLPLPRSAERRLEGVRTALVASSSSSSQQQHAPLLLRPTALTINEVNHRAAHLAPLPSNPPLRCCAPHALEVMFGSAFIAETPGGQDQANATVAASLAAGITSFDTAAACERIL